MLFQLVCTDRRYARMNCFNIRELQGMLKRKYFVDLLNTLDHKDLLNQSMINLRFKTNLNNNLGLDFSNFQNLGLHKLGSPKNFLYTHAGNNSYVNQEGLKLGLFDNLFLGHTSNFSINIFVNFMLNTSFYDAVCFLIKTLNFYLTFFFTNFFTLGSFISNLNLSGLMSFPSLTLFFSCVSNNIIFIDSSYYYYSIFYKNNSTNYYDYDLKSFLSQDNSIIFNNESISLVNNSFLEKTNSLRFNRFNNALVEYDYKVGNYIGDWGTKYPYLITTFLEVARGIKKPS
jgi:hypothetical protein